MPLGTVPELSQTSTFVLPAGYRAIQDLALNISLQEPPVLPLIVKMPYNQSLVENPADLTILHFKNGVWTAMPRELEQDNNVISFWSQDFSLFVAAFAEFPAPEIELVSPASDLTVQQANISISLRVGSQDLTLKKGGQAVVWINEEQFEAVLAEDGQAKLEASLTPGANIIYAEVADSRDQKTASPQVTVTYEPTENPVLVRIDSPFAGYTNINNPELVFKIGGAYIKREVWVDEILSDLTSGERLDPQAEGPHQVRVGALTEDGIWVEDAVSFIVDTIPPDPPAITPAGGSYSSPVTISVTAEPGALLYYTTNGENPTAAAIPFPSAITLQSNSVFKIVAYDLAGNISNIAAAEFNFTAPKAMLEITTSPVAGDIYVDNVYQGQGSAVVEVMLGNHTVSFGKERGYTTPASITVTSLTADERRVILATYAEISASEDETSASASKAFIVTTDYATGNAAIMDLSDYSIYTNIAPADAVAADPGPAVYRNGYVYVVNRTNADNITCFDVKQPGNIIGQFSVGNGANPHNIVFKGNKAYIPRYNEAELWVVDVSDYNPNDWTKIEEIDLSGFDVNDGVPDMTEASLIGDKLFVPLQLQNNWTPADHGLLAVIDTTTDELIDVNPATPKVDAIVLTSSNPLATSAYGNVLAVQECGNGYVTGDGGVDFINTADYTVQGLTVNETDFDGNMSSSLILTGADTGYVVVDADWNNWGAFSCLYAFYLNGGNPEVDLLMKLTAFQQFQGLAVSSEGYLMAGVRSTSNPGIVVYNTAQKRWRIDEPISTGLPPWSICFY